MLLIYSHNITPRLKYIFKQVCTRILDIPVSFTTSIQEFVAHGGLKLSYTNHQLGNEFFIKSHSILFEQGLSDVEINVHDWDETKCFFYIGDKGEIPFDIFAASFYLISRYEEYLPHVKDEFGRFSFQDSVAHKHKFLEQPVVDIWAHKFKKALADRFPKFQFKERAYNVCPIIDVPMAYYFEKKGLMRTIGGTVNDIIRFKIRRLYHRYLAIFGLRKDPYDTFDWLIDTQKKSKTKFLVFFLIGDYSTYDKNISVNKKKFISLIKSVGDYCKVGLKASFFALDNFEILKREKLKMESIINSNLEHSRNSFSKLNLPNTYRNMVDLEVNNDYTMGYVNAMGFRAGTCTPFLFYDLDYEIQTPLTINSFHLMDFSLLSHRSQLDKQQTLDKIIQQVKVVGGTFTPVFHNYTFSADTRWKGFKALYLNILKSVDEA